MIFFKDEKYHFYEFFNNETGFLVRSDSLDTGKNPIQRSFPELLDIGIMGKCLASKQGLCKNAGIDCYQMALNSKKENMSFNCYKQLIDESSGKVFQVALGGAGDPNKHPDFSKILAYTREKSIIPNYTTSGFLLTDEEIYSTKKYCGAVAVSFYSRLKNGQETNKSTISSIKRFIVAGCRTNIHFVISSDTIDEAIYRLEHNLFPSGISAVIFLLYKPAGFGIKEKVLSFSDVRVSKLIHCVESQKFAFEIGFDTCFTPAIIAYSKNIDHSSIDCCESARFSMYIDSEMNAYPCSFDVASQQYRYSLKGKMIIDAWKSEIFQNFRNKQEKSCPNCSNKTMCMGGCTLFPMVNLCGIKFNQ